MRRVVRFGGIPAHDASTATPAWCVRLINAAHVEGTVHHIRTWNTDARALCKQSSKESGPQCSGSTADGPKDTKTYLEMSPHYFSTLIQADLLHSSSALTWFFSRCCSICFLRRKQNWVISSSSYSSSVLWTGYRANIYWINAVLEGRRSTQSLARLYNTLEVHLYGDGNISLLSRCLTSAVMCLFFFYPAGGASAFCFSSRYIFLKQFKGFSVDCLS